MSIVEALKGIWLDVSQNMPTTRSKVKGMTMYARVLGSEVAGIVSMVPYACKSWWLYRRGSDGRVQVSKNCRYGSKERNILDVYMPMRGKLGGSNAGDTVVLFVHGGVWATGSKWHYAPLATRLAQEGIVTCVMEYSLYPSCHADTMVGEVSQALDWVLDVYGSSQEGNGDTAPYLGEKKRNVVLVGHSAGAHLCAMALLERSRSHDSVDEQASTINSKVRMPDCFVGIAGVYDIAQHFEYEKSRNVHHLSTMKRAMGGEDMFPLHSPTVVLKRSLSTSRKSFRRRPRSIDTRGSRVLHGERIPRRAGLESDQSMLMEKTCDHWHASTLRLEAIQRLPRTYLMASCADITVPWTESSEFHLMLTACGMEQSKLLLYHGVGHGNFVVDWTPQGKQPECSTNGVEEFSNPLPEFAQDMLQIIQDTH